MKFQRYYIYAIAGFFSSLLFGCAEQATEPEIIIEPGSFGLIQEKIFDLHCATSGCHNSVSSSGGLVLEAKVSYSNLINIDPNNTPARDAGLKRIRPASPDSSFLFIKTDEHVDHDFGDRMPLGNSIQMGEDAREYIRQWILAGAPKSGFVADEALLLKPIIQPVQFVPLAPPAHGVQLHLAPFPIVAGSEREIFVYDRLSNSDTLFVNGVDIKMREGSHHFILYKYSGTNLPQGQIRDLTINSVLQEMTRTREFIIGAQTPELSYTLPENVVIPLVPSQGFDLNSHYVNPGGSTADGEVYVNLRTIPKSENFIVAKALFDNFADIILPANQTTAVQRTVTFTSPRSIVMLSSHTHKRGKSFKIYRVGGPEDGILLYENYSWDHPPTKTFTPPLQFEAGWGYRVVAEYENETSRTILFGFTSEDEMCIALGYYY